MSEQHFTPGTKFCSSCGAQVLPEAIMCVKCGCALKPASSVSASGKSRIAYALLYMFVGLLGIHEFYAGKTGKGVLWLVITLIVGILTLGVSIIITGIWALIMSIVWLTRTDEEFEKYVQS